MRVLAVAATLICSFPACAGSLDSNRLFDALSNMAGSFAGRVGICVENSAATTCINGEQSFPMQSVTKLLVAIAVLEAVDQGNARLDEAITVTADDLTIGPQPIAKLVAAEGYKTTVDDLLFRMVADSDSAAYRILLRRVGGAAAVQAVLDRHQIAGIRSDRDELQMNLEIMGLQWRQQYRDRKLLDQAIGEVPSERRQELFDAYLKDPQDTATPKGMANLLTALRAGRLLSSGSSRRLLDILRRTNTFPDRLKAGLLPGWTIGHKTGTGPSWRGITSAMNDVGIITAPDGGTISAAVFISASPLAAKEQASFIAEVARKIVESYH